MRLSREKIVRLSHQITEVLVSSDEVEFVEDRDTIRQQVVQILTDTLKEEEKADAEVRKRITSQKKEILEGSEEWASPRPRMAAANVEAVDSRPFAVSRSYPGREKVLILENGIDRAQQGDTPLRKASEGSEHENRSLTQLFQIERRADRFDLWCDNLHHGIFRSYILRIVLQPNRGSIQRGRRVLGGRRVDWLVV
jgi:hypothetical protein